MSDGLLKWLKRATREYAQRKRTAEKLVERWQWMTKPARDVEPLYYERHGWGGGRPIAKAPAKPKFPQTAYGFDGDERLVVTREYLNGGGMYQHFHDWRDDRVEWVCYSPDKKAQMVHRARLDGSRVVATESRGEPGGYSVRFEYAGELVTHIAETYRSAGRGRASTATYDVTWDEAGRLQTIVQSDRKPPQTRYEAASRTLSLEQLLRLAAERLVDEIPRRIKKARLRHSAYCVIVSFAGEGNDNFPPDVGVGLERERKKVATRGTALWNAADFDHYDTELPRPPARSGD
jgi:hypothetical protein